MNNFRKQCSLGLPALESTRWSTIHYTACSGEQDTPSENILQGIWVVGAGHILQLAQEKLAAIFADHQLHLAQDFFLAECVLDVQEAQLGFQVCCLRHGTRVEAALGHQGVVVTVQDHTMSFKCVAQAAEWHSENKVINSRPAIWLSFSKTATALQVGVRPVHVESNRTVVDLADGVRAGKLLVAPDVGPLHGVLDAFVHRFRHDVVREPDGP